METFAAYGYAGDFMEGLAANAAIVREKELEKTAERLFCERQNRAAEIGQQGTREDPPPTDTLSVQHQALIALNALENDLYEALNDLIFANNAASWGMLICSARRRPSVSELIS